MALCDSALKQQLIRDIHKYEAVKFGSFVLKSGVTSPFYVDIRICVSHPTFLKAIAEAVRFSLFLLRRSRGHRSWKAFLRQ